MAGAYAREEEHAFREGAAHGSAYLRAYAAARSARSGARKRTPPLGAASRLDFSPTFVRARARVSTSLVSKHARRVSRGARALSRRQIEEKNTGVGSPRRCARKICLARTRHASTLVRRRGAPTPTLRGGRSGPRRAVRRLRCSRLAPSSSPRPNPTGPAGPSATR